jgi:hypothetical protein
MNDLIPRVHAWNRATQTSDPSALVIPFGKHKDATVAEVLATDPSYADWLLAQAWFAERFATLHAALLTRGAGTDDTPEHNALQARFLDPLFRAAFLLLRYHKHLTRCRDLFWAHVPEMRAQNLAEAEKLAAYWTGGDAGAEDHPQRRFLPGENPDSWSGQRYSRELAAWEANRSKKLPDALANLAGARADLTAALPPVTLKTSVKFEQRGVDVVVSGHMKSRGDTPPWFTREHAEIWQCVDISTDRFRSVSSCIETGIELKPTIGDDYPTVMRQMQRLECRHLVIGNFSGRGVSLPVMCQMFETNGMRVSTVQDIEVCIPAAREWVE